MKRMMMVWMVALFAALGGYADVPQLINYQGRLLNGTTGLIQTYTVDIFSGQTDITFGPPVHRTPDDWRSLYAAMLPQSL